jgi:hypothetical protein
MPERQRALVADPLLKPLELPHGQVQGDGAFPVGDLSR